MTYTRPVFAVKHRHAGISSLSDVWDVTSDGEVIDGRWHMESGIVKDYDIVHNIGKCRYVINYCDGVKTHADGSRFYDIVIFSNKRVLNARIAELKRAGYTEK